MSNDSFFFDLFTLIDIRQSSSFENLGGLNVAMKLDLTRGVTCFQECIPLMKKYQSTIDTTLEECVIKVDSNLFFSNGLKDDYKFSLSTALLPRIVSLVLNIVVVDLDETETDETELSFANLEWLQQLLEKTEATQLEFQFEDAEPTHIPDMIQALRLHIHPIWKLAILIPGKDCSILFCKDTSGYLLTKSKTSGSFKWIPATPFWQEHDRKMREKQFLNLNL